MLARLPIAEWALLVSPVPKSAVEQGLRGAYCLQQNLDPVSECENEISVLLVSHDDLLKFHDSSEARTRPKAAHAAPPGTAFRMQGEDIYLCVNSKVWVPRIRWNDLADAKVLCFRCDFP